MSYTFQADWGSHQIVLSQLQAEKMLNLEVLKQSHYTWLYFHTEKTIKLAPEALPLHISIFFPLYLFCNKKVSVQVEHQNWFSPLFLDSLV